MRADSPELTAHTLDGTLVHLHKQKAAIYCRDAKGNRIKTPFGAWSDVLPWIEGVRWDIALLAFEVSGELEKDTLPETVK